MCSLENVNDQAWRAFSGSQLKRCSLKAPKNRVSAAMIFTGMAISRLTKNAKIGECRCSLLVNEDLRLCEPRRITWQAD